MAQDEILKEVRAIREAYGDRFGFDVRALYRDAKERERKAQRSTVSLPPKRLPARTREKSRA
jgi:hypothetical protein